MRHRIALCGFSEFEYRAMHFSFQHPDDTEIGYEVVNSLAEADFAVVDADSKLAIESVALSGHISTAVFVGSTAPPGAAALVPRPIDLSRIMRALAELSGQHAPPLDVLLPDGYDDPDETIIFEPPVLTDAVQVPPPREPPAAAPEPEPAPAPESEPEPIEPAVDARHAKKAAARAAARRARMSHVHTDPGQLEQMRDVLVLDADVKSSAHLSGLLELFGFRVHVARNILQAADILSQRPLVAAFLDIAFDGADQGDGLTLLQTIHDLPRLVGHNAPAVLTVTAKLQPANRVRAALFGISSPLIKPVTRGDVARALEACDVILPSDARRL
jgi:CheY-like chemotaxis protein